MFSFLFFFIILLLLATFPPHGEIGKTARISHFFPPEVAGKTFPGVQNAQGESRT